MIHKNIYKAVEMQLTIAAALELSSQIDHYVPAAQALALLEGHNQFYNFGRAI
jgi:hypothetical protein